VADEELRLSTGFRRRRRMCPVPFRKDILSAHHANGACLNAASERGDTSRAPARALAARVRVNSPGTALDW